MDRDKDPEEPFRVLIRELDKILTAKDLHIENAVHLINVDGKGMIQVVLHIGDDAFKDDEQKAFDAQFEELRMHEHREEQEKKIRDSHEELRRQVENMKNGILDDDDD